MGVWVGVGVGGRVRGCVCGGLRGLAVWGWVVSACGRRRGGGATQGRGGWGGGGGGGGGDGEEDGVREEEREVVKNRV